MNTIIIIYIKNVKVPWVNHRPVLPRMPFPSIPQSPSHPSRSPFPVLPAVPFPSFPQSSFLSFPQFLAGIHSQNSLSLGFNRESYPFGEASTTSEW